MTGPCPHVQSQWVPCPHVQSWFVTCRAGVWNKEFAEVSLPLLLPPRQMEWKNGAHGMHQKHKHVHQRNLVQHGVEKSKGVLEKNPEASTKKNSGALICPEASTKKKTPGPSNWVAAGGRVFILDALL